MFHLQPADDTRAIKEGFVELRPGRLIACGTNAPENGPNLGRWLSGHQMDDNTRIRLDTANARYGLASGKDAAAICAMSISFGAVGDRFASASRNIVLQNGHAAPTTSAPVSISSLARV